MPELCGNGLITKKSRRLSGGPTEQRSLGANLPLLFSDRLD